MHIMHLNSPYQRRRTELPAIDRKSGSSGESLGAAGTYYACRGATMPRSQARGNVRHQRSCSWERVLRKLVGPPGLEPGTNGFTYSRYFYRARTISPPSATGVPLGRGTLWPVIKGARGSRELQPSGSLCTFLRCTAGLAQDCHRHVLERAEGFPEFIPFISGLSTGAHLSMSPLL